jgi:hypothetical protein
VERVRVRVVVGALLAAAAVSAVGGTPAHSSAAAAVTYTDVQHESGAAPDLQSATIDMSGGTATIAVAVSAFPAPKLPAGDLENVFTCFDVDGKIETGSRGGGCDYGIEVQRSSAPGERVYVTHWVNGRSTVALDPPAVHVEDTAGGFTLTFPLSTIGRASTFAFYIDADRVRQYPTETVASDFLPDHGRLHYPSEQPSAPAAGSGQATLTDPLGDARGGVDLSNVTVGDGPNGALNIGVTVKGLKDGGDVVVDFDTDQNPATGAGGRDYSLDVTNDPIFGWGYEIDRWASGDWQYVDSGDVAISGPATTITLTLPRHDLGGTSGFDMYALAVNSDFDGYTTGRDDAPDSTWWRYTPVALSGDQLVRPVIGAPASSGAPVAGRVWTVTYPVTRADDGTPFPVMGVDGNGLTVGFGYLFARPTFGKGFVRWKLRVPAGDRGKTLTVAFGAYSATQSAYAINRFRIR